MNNPHKNQNYTEQDKQQCPFYKKKLEQTPFNEKIAMSSNKKYKHNFEENSNQKQCKKIIAGNQNDSNKYQGSGCPMMQTSKENQNPGLFVPEVSMPIPYVSPFSEFLEQKNFQKQMKYENWEGYPIYLKETLFYYNENFQKLRNVEVGYKFFSSEELREKANQYYNKGEYYKAINCISKAISIFRWLEVDFDMQNGNIKNKELQDEQKSFESFQSFFKDKLSMLMFQHFHDDNVKLNEFKTCKEEQEIDMEKNTLFNLYKNLAIYFQKAGHHYEAQQVINDMEQLGIKNSVFYYKKAQVICANKLSSIKQLKETLIQLQHAIEMKQNEEIYTHNIHFLKIFGLENHETMFQKLQELIEIEILNKEVQEHKIVQKITEKIIQYLKTEKLILDKGQVPQYTSIEDDYMIGIKNLEIKLIQKIDEIYLNAFNFYNKDDNKKDHDIIKAEYCHFQQVKDEFNQWMNIRVEKILQNKIFKQTLEQNKFKINKQKFSKLILKYSRKNAKDVLEKSNINLSIYQFALEALIKQQTESSQCQAQQSFYYNEGLINIIQRKFQEFQISKNFIFAIFVIVSLVIVSLNFPKNLLTLKQLIQKFYKIYNVAHIQSIFKKTYNEEKKNYIQSQVQTNNWDFQDLGLKDDDIIFFQVEKSLFCNPISINLSGNNISVNFLQKLFDFAHFFVNLININLSENKLLSQGDSFILQLINLIQKFEKISILNLSRLGLQNNNKEELFSLISLNKIQYIDLSWNNFDNEFLEELFQIIKLQEIQTIIKFKGNNITNLKILQKFERQQKLVKANVNFKKENQQANIKLKKPQEQSFIQTRLQKLTYFKDQTKYNQQLEKKLKTYMHKLNQNIQNVFEQIKFLENDCQSIESLNEQKLIEFQDLKNQQEILKSKLKQAINRYNEIKNKNNIEKKLKENFFNIFQYQKDQIKQNQQTLYKDILENYQKLQYDINQQTENKKLIIQQNISNICYEIESIKLNKKKLINDIQEKNQAIFQVNNIQIINDQKKQNLNAKKLNNIQSKIIKLDQQLNQLNQTEEQQIQQNGQQINQVVQQNQNIQDHIQKLKEQTKTTNQNLEQFSQNYNKNISTLHQKEQELIQLQQLFSKQQNIIFQNFQILNQQFMESQNENTKQINFLDDQIQDYNDKINQVQEEIKIQQEKRQLGIQLAQSKLEKFIKKNFEQLKKISKFIQKQCSIVLSKIIFLMKISRYNFQQQYE